MLKSFVEYNFDSDTVQYPTTYDATKINLGYLMKKSTDENGKIYVSPYEPIFLRGYELYSLWTHGTMSALRYDSNTIWLFYTYPPNTNAAKSFFLAEYNFSAQTITELGYVNISVSPSNNNNTSYNLNASLEFHTGGTVSVSSNIVTGIGTTWRTDGVCAGNRIGFGSTNPNQITTWYEVLSISGDTSLTIRKSLVTDGSTTNLNISAGTPYVIEDLRLLYASYGAALADTRALYIVKGLRKEIFSYSPTAIPTATSVDAQRATYRLMDTLGGVSTGSNNYIPNGFALMDKVSLAEQYGYTLTYNNAAQISIQKFNVRASLTGLTGSRSFSPFVLTTGIQSHNGTNTLGYNPIIKSDNNNLYVTHSTRISRIPVSAVTASSTSFIVSQMLEIPPGGTNTFPVANNLDSSHYMPVIDRFYINNQTGYRNYVTPYISGSTQFERVIHIADTIQQSSYLDFNFNYLTSHTLGAYFYSTYNSGLSFLSRATATNNNILYVLPLEADKNYESITNACIISPIISTLSAITYDKVYFYTTSTWNSDDRFSYPREIFDAYYRVTGMTDNSGSWRLISQNGSLSGITSQEIQFKFTFRTIGDYCVPTRIHGLTITYSANTIPVSTAFYEPSLKYSSLSSNIFAWRQRDSFQSNIPNLKLDIYNTSDDSLLLTDSVNTSSNGVWQYTIDGINWNPWVSSADTIGNYVRYSASTLSASGLKIKPILYI